MIRIVLKTFCVIFLTACAASKSVVVLEKPKVAIVSISEQVSPWQTLVEVEAMRPYAYFYYPKATSYKIVYLTPVGKIPFLEKEIPLDGIFDFWPSVLTAFNYEENPSKLVYVIKDIVYATPCYVKVQAWNGIKWSAWSDSVLVR